MSEEVIEILGARENNLRNFDLTIPRDQLVVITGLSGSGKSSLAFDTIYAEGQRRYIETFDAYARQFLGELERPDVDKINGLSPVISIEQKTVSKNPRSTVGTITEIYDFLRLLYSRAATAYSYATGQPMVKYNEEEILTQIQKKFAGKKTIFLAPIVKARKGHYRELFEQFMRQGFLRARVDGQIVELTKGMKLDRYKVHDIELVIDRLAGNEPESRIKDSVRLALKQGKGSMMVAPLDEKTKIEVQHYSKFLMCPISGISYPEPEPNLFSFNSPYGACPHCNGLGEVAEIDLKKIVPDDNLSIKKGGIAPLGQGKQTWIFQQIESVLQGYEVSSLTPIKDIPKEAMQVLLYGTEDTVVVTMSNGQSMKTQFDGIIAFIERQAEDDASPAIRRWAEGFMNKVACPECQGARLKKESLYFKVNGKHIFDLAAMDLKSLSTWMESAHEGMSERQLKIAREPLKEIKDRLRFLIDVGLEYLTLHRSSKTLSGGEAQRIRLASQIGAQLVGVLYILDEPSIGLHQRDNQKLINSLKSLRDVGNSVLVVEHDKDMMLSADYLVDIGPGAGVHGGKVVEQGPPAVHLKGKSVTGQYLSGKRKIEVPKKRRKGNGKFLELNGARGHNLKHVNLKIPLGTFTCIAGVSGGGKSSLINHTLYPILAHHFYDNQRRPLPYKTIKGLEHLDKVVEIDQSPIGRTPRSNPSTYTGIFTDIRQLFAQHPEAKVRGYQPGRFSFNVSGGRCETCKGGGVKVIEMNFLPDVMVECEDCNGKRYNRETLEVRYKGKSIADVLAMTVDEGVVFFE
ncbi:MAG: excinuclease subunit UvrA, partial [Bacteroidota bacterium]